MEYAPAADFYILRSVQMQHEQIVAPVSRFLIQNFQRRRKKPHAGRYGKIRCPLQSRRLPVNIRRDRAKGLCEFGVCMIIRQKPPGTIPLNQNEQACPAAVFPISPR